MKNTIKYLGLIFLAFSINYGLFSAEKIKVVPAEEINSPDDDFAPTLVNKNHKMFFTSDRNGNQRLYEVRRDSQGKLYLTGKTKGDINDAIQVGSATLTPDGNYMIFAAYEHYESGEGRTDLYSAKKEKGKWVDIINLGPNINSNYWDSQPTLSADGQTLYFVSDRPGGKGGTDIYVSTRTSEGWRKAQNVTDINSKSDEMSPILALDGNTFSFASNRVGSLGGFDIFFTKKNGKEFSAPTNAGSPINTAYDELFYVPVQNTKQAYLSSNRAGGKGNFDIYNALPNPHEASPVIFITGQVVDKETGKPMAAQVVITDLKTNRKIAKFNCDDETGEFLVALKPGDTYSVTATAPDYFFYSEKFSIPDSSKDSELSKDIQLSKNSTRLLVSFDFNKATLSNESIPDLDNLLEMLKEKQSTNCVLEGHTDDVGSDDFNMKLSLERAEAVKAWLVSKGINSNRIETKGYGESRPLVNDTTEEARAMNRRVEIKLK